MGTRREHSRGVEFYSNVIRVDLVENGGEVGPLNIVGKARRPYPKNVYARF